MITMRFWQNCDISSADRRRFQGNMKTSRIFIIVWTLGLGSVGAAAQTGVSAQPPLLGPLMSCRTEPNDAARLRCYDLAAGSLSEATAKGEVVIVTRDDIRRTRRSLFGFSLPKLPFFGGDNSQQDQAEEVVAVITSVRQKSASRYLLRFDDGSSWETTGGSSIPPQIGQSATIKRAALGSYFIRVDGRAVKAKRIE